MNGTGNYCCKKGHDGWVHAKRSEQIQLSETNTNTLASCELDRSGGPSSALHASCVMKKSASRVLYSTWLLWIVIWMKPLLHLSQRLKRPECEVVFLPHCRRLQFSSFLLRQGESPPRERGDEREWCSGGLTMLASSSKGSGYHAEFPCFLGKILRQDHSSCVSSMGTYMCDDLSTSLSQNLSSTVI